MRGGKEERRERKRSRLVDASKALLSLLVSLYVAKEQDLVSRADSPVSLDLGRREERKKKKEEKKTPGLSFYTPPRSALTRGGGEANPSTTSMSPNVLYAAGTRPRVPTGER